jgi:subtilisin family serine protease
MNQESSVYRKQGWKLVLLVLMAALTLVSNSYGANQPQESMPFETLSLPPEALSWTVDAITDTRSLQNPQLDSSLADLAAAAAASDQAALDLAQSQSLRLSEGRVHIQIVTHAAGLQEAIQAVTAAGGEVTKVSNDDALIQGWLPIRSLEVVADHEDVYLIRRPPELVFLENVQAGSLTTEGLVVLNGPAWHTAGHTGTGVKIGIIDGGFLGYTGLLGSDLPASVTVKNFVDGESDAQVDGTTKHGTACAEIVHDIAPAAGLYLAKIATNLDLQEAVAWLKDTHQVHIISTSIGWYNLTPGDGTGEFADLVQSARNAGIFWATAAGNDREAHWGGLYHDPNNTGWHYYNADQNVNFFGPGDGTFYAIPSGYLIRVFLRWDDWTNVNQDYDLYLLRWSGSSWNVIASSTNWQNGQPGQTPTELAAAVSSGAATAYGFAIKRYSSTQVVNFEVFAPRLARIDKLLHARSLANLADAPAAITVAALDVVSPYSQEPYSSQGPTNGPGGTETGGSIKPDIAAFANVSTVSYGTANKFNGTSAATPHVAGAAALVLSAYPAYTPQQVQSFLQGRAVDMGPSGKDTIYGYGRLHLGSPTTTPWPEGNKAYLPLVMKHYP